jgi:putative thioredoxin
MTGAIDLAAVKARSDAQARAAERPPAAPGAYVIDVDEAGFQVDVLERSMQVPVLLDLWADWCQPCKQLSPVLEKLANEGAGSWVLAKIDVDANPAISQALRVQSIPTVFAVIGGQVVPGFSGALPEAQVRDFVAAVLEAAQQAGLAGPAPEVADAEAVAEAPSDPRFDAAEEFLDAGQYTDAAAAFQAILDVEPTNAEAALGLRQTAFLERLESVPPDAVTRADAAASDVALQLAAADQELAANDISAALDRLLGLVVRIRGDERDAVRDRLLDYFELIGAQDERVAPARRRLANALF